jgi:phosphoribosylglycinamide formyltransferase-1
VTRVAILISGGGSNMVALVKSMVGDHPARPCLVLSNNETAGGLDKVANLGVETAVVDHRAFKDREAFETALTTRLETAETGLICLAGFMRILTPHFITHWQGRILNIHPSLLPKYPGLNTHQRAIDAGDTQAGCTVHEVIADLDAGPILGQASVPILPEDTPDTLAARVLTVEHHLYPKVLRRFASGDKTRADLPA